MVKIIINKKLCKGCGTCVDFCPTSVLQLEEVNGKKTSIAVRCEDCCACETCVGQCPQDAIKIINQISIGESTDVINKYVPPTLLNKEEQEVNKEFSESLEAILTLHWKPVAVTLIPKDVALPDIPFPRTRLRYCQSLVLAGRGKTLLMPPQLHACPDGTHILGLTNIPPKLASGELYIKFGKLASIEAARQMIAERPRLPEQTIRATLVSPLVKAVMKPDIVIIIAPPESIMWLCMASSFYDGKRSNFKVSGYNSQCVECTLYPYLTGEVNISLGCYGCRASSQLSAEMMFMGIPFSKLPALVKGLKELGKKAILDSRSKIYISPEESYQK
jgi:uncharacterized protein (DUF169 family)/NAD-dependent dihydropyrimidine dehydrogenase PreA subunit